MTRRALAAAFILLFARGSMAAVDTYAMAAGDTIVVRSTITGGTAYAGQSLVIMAELVGSGQSPEVITPTPLPIEAVDTEQVVIFRYLPPERERFYVIESRLIDQSGTLSVPQRSTCVPPRAYAACGPAIAARGRLVGAGASIVVEVDVCEGSNWVPCGAYWFAMDAAPGWEGLVGTGIIVNIYANAVYYPVTACTMPPPVCGNIVRVEPVTGPQGCNAVAVANETWGSLKSRFR